MRLLRLLVPAILLMLVGLGVPRPAAALSCISQSDIVAKMDVIVRGKITAIPQDGMMELAVSREYKGGSGAAKLTAEVPGLGQGQRMDWNRTPKVGDELIIGLVRRGDALINTACHLFVQLEPGQEPNAEIQKLIGLGQAVAGGADPGQGPVAKATADKAAADKAAAGKVAADKVAADKVAADRLAAAQVEQRAHNRSALTWLSGGGVATFGAAAWLIWRGQRRTG